MKKLMKTWLAGLLALLLALPLQAAEIGDFETTDANNTARWPEGMTFANVNDSARADEGILARFYKDVNGSLTTTGSSNAYAVAANQTLTAYYTGLWLRAKVNFTNTGAATLNVDSLGTKALKRANGADPASGDIVSGTVYDFVYDGTNFQILGLNALADGIISTAKIADSAVTSAKILDGTIAWGDLAQTIFNQSGTSPATGDLVPFADASDSGNRKVTTIANLLALGGAGFKGIQAFTSSGTYTPTTGMTKCIVISTGGGGGGGGADSNGTGIVGAAGGTAGATAIEVFDAATIGASQTVTIGAAGTAGSGQGGNGGAGGNTTFGALHTAGGGPGGTGTGLNASSTNGAIAAPAASSATGGLINIPGGLAGGGFGHGGTGSIMSTGGAGGASFWGGGGGETTAASGDVTAGTAGQGFGAGGSGASNSQQTTEAGLGGVGKAGIVVVLEFGSN